MTSPVEAKTSAALHERAPARDEVRSMRIPVAILILICVVAPFLIYPVFLMKMLCWALFACAFNLLLGYVGLLSFGHALFFGGAGYLAAHAAKVWGLPFELAVLTGNRHRGLLGLAVGWLAIRRQGIYFAMITLALAQMFYFFCLRAPFTGGEDGIQGVPRGKLLGLLSLENDLTMYFVVLAIFLFGFFFIFRVSIRPSGRCSRRCGRTSRGQCRSGYKSISTSCIAFVLSAALAGLAGGTKSIVFQLASLTDVHWGTSGEGDPDGAPRRAGGPCVRAHRGRGGDHLRGELPRRAGRLGDGGPGRAVRGVRARLPPGHHRRAVAGAPPATVMR
jgi:branched-chain amino acid transport system permease protein